MNKDPFSEVETLKRKVKDLNRELFHTRNLVENLREENKQLNKKVKTLEFFKKGDGDTVAHATSVIDEMRSHIAHLTETNQQYKGKMQEQQDQIADLKNKMQSVVNQSDELIEGDL